MPLPVYRLRRVLAVITVLFTAVIAGMYLYARMRQHSVLKEVPNKIGFEIKQTASGFQISKSEAGRTLFTIRAKDVKEFKLNGRADLHDVSVILYGRDTSRFDQIYGDDFTYDPKSGDVTAKGDVQIDLQANPAGSAAPDQAVPKQLKDPIHLRTRDLVFNRNSGDAYTDARVDFSTPQATGWALGIHYSAKPGKLTLVSQVHVTLTGENDAKLFAAHGVITRDPREITLDHPRMERESGTLQSDEATFFLGPENEVQRIEASGNVNAETSDQAAEKMRARADKADLLLASKQNLLRTATLTGKVHIEREGDQPMQGDAGRVVLDFLGQNILQKARASEEVRIAQRTIISKKPSSDNSTPQDFDITAAAIDFIVAEGRRLDHAQTSGAAQITIFPAQNENQNSATPSQRTLVTASRFDAKFVATDRGATRLASVHGAPNAKIISISPSEPDRISTSQTLDATFLPEGGISSIIQQGSVNYTDGQPPERRTEAAAEKAVYTPANQILQLSGSPRISDGGMLTTANGFRINRATNDICADGDVKSTYNEVKEQPNGALLASSSPIHVTSTTMTAHNSPAIALYEGNARLWQDANIIGAPSIQFNRNDRSLVAQGARNEPVSTVLVEQKLNSEEVVGQKPINTKGNDRKSKKRPEENLGQASPITITALRLTYSDPDRRAHYSDGVNARGTDFDARADQMDVYLLPRSQSSSQNSNSQTSTTPGKLDRMVAQGNVILQEPHRRAKCQNLIYTASDDKFVLTGGPPSIFDAEHGKITGDSLTFFRADDRVLVEGELSTPVVTQTRVKK
jgi:lipopolysaccharide export system protein LptA